MLCGRNKSLGVNQSHRHKKAFVISLSDASGTNESVLYALTFIQRSRHATTTRNNKYEKSPFKYKISRRRHPLFVSRDRHRPQLVSNSSWNVSVCRADRTKCMWFHHLPHIVTTHHSFDRWMCNNKAEVNILSRLKRKKRRKSFDFFHLLSSATHILRPSSLPMHRHRHQRTHLNHIARSEQVDVQRECTGFTQQRSPTCTHFWFHFTVEFFRHQDPVMPLHRKWTK